MVCAICLLVSAISRRLGEGFVLIVSFGAAFPTFYRLTGPFQSELAPQIVKTELWDTIKRRGVIGNIFMGVIPMVRRVQYSV